MSIQPEPEYKDINVADLKLKGFKVHQISGNTNPSAAHGRRDFYKIGLVTGDMTIHYGDQSFRAKGTFLFCGNPHVPHSVIIHKEPRGHACLFTEDFIASKDRTEGLHHSPLFRFGAVPVIPVNKKQAAFINGLYQKMLTIHTGDYDYKDEMLKSCIELIIHEALHLQPAQSGIQYQNAATRITNLFLELLERQFPIERTTEPLRLRTAQHFAEKLSVHVNYLNRSVKELTGKPTSVHIAERIAAEAKALLQHTDWSVADIAYSLGFEYPAYFNNYFKRVTGSVPKSFRKK
jgi:AraC family transcriptional activator of pobA